MKLSPLFLTFLILLTGCNSPIIDEIQEQDIKKYGLSDHFDELTKLGIQGMKIEEREVIFYVKDPNQKTRKKIEEGLYKIFGKNIEFTMRSSEELNIKAKP